jgi:cystathionine beta-synthase
MTVQKSILEAIGNTPLVRLKNLVRPGWAKVYAKAEFMNPGGSVKDRMALYMIERAEKKGWLKPGGTIVENTSGNTGAGVAMVAALKGYKAIFTMPDKMSAEKVNLLKAFGAKVVVTPTNVPADSPLSYYETAKRIARETPNSFYLNQYHNPLNIEAHYQTTGPEIWRQAAGRIDYLVAGMGTGGTISGVGKFLKEKNPKIQVIGVDPVGSVYYNYFKTGRIGEPHVYKVEGIGEDMLCGAMDFSVVDQVVQVTDQECFIMAREVATKEGMLVGGSSGGAALVALNLAKKLPKNKVIVTIFPDSGTRYLSKFYNDEWMKDNGFLEEKVFLGTVKDLLKGRGPVVVARSTDRVSQVINKMKKYDISQLPVMSRGRLVGIVTEVDLLKYMVTGRHRLNDSIKSLVESNYLKASPETSLSDLSQKFSATESNVAMVLDGEEKLLGIITKIDIIDYLAKRFKQE